MKAETDRFSAAELVLTWDEAADPAPMPSWKSTVWFVPLVLALSAVTQGSVVFERLGTTTPGWWPTVEVTIGGSVSPVWALLIVGGLTMGWSGVRRLLRASLCVRVDGRLYAVAASAPVILWASPGVADSREVGTLVSIERRTGWEDLPRGSEAQGGRALPAG